MFTISYMRKKRGGNKGGGEIRDLTSTLPFQEGGGGTPQLSLSSDNKEDQRLEGNKKGDANSPCSRGDKGKKHFLHIKRKGGGEGAYYFHSFRAQWGEGEGWD